MFLRIICTAITQDMNTATANLRKQHNPNHDVSSDILLAGYHAVFTFDWMQHEPTSGEPWYAMASASPDRLLSLAAGPSSQQNRKARGRLAWLKVDQAVIFQEQHRFSDNTPGGARLLRLVKILWAEHGPSEAELDEVLDTLQGCMVPEEAMPAFLARQPRAVVLRNKTKATLNRYVCVQALPYLGRRG